MKHKRHNRGLYHRTAKGAYDAEVNFATIRYRKRLRTEHEARRWIDSVIIDLDNQFIPLDQFTAYDARQALEMLPAGVSLVEAAKCYAKAHQKPDSIPLAEAVDRFLAEKKAAGLRPRSISELRIMLNRVKMQ